MNPMSFLPGLLRTELTPEATVVRITARRLDDSNVEVLGGRLSALAGEQGGAALRLDLDAVEYLTSEALGMFVGLNRRARAAGGALCLYNLRPCVYELFEVTRLTQVLDVRPKGLSRPREEETRDS